MAVPIRPPAEQWVTAPDEEQLNRFFQILSDKVDPVEYLISYEGTNFTLTGKVEEDLLSITAVHPMREEAVGGVLAKAGADWSVVSALIDQGQLVETQYEGHTFYMRKLRGGGSER